LSPSTLRLWQRPWHQPALHAAAQPEQHQGQGDQDDATALADADSRWQAFEEERKRGQIVLLPLRIDDAVMDTKEAWAVKLRAQRHVGDFRRWKDHDGYKKSFERVLRDLKYAGEPESDSDLLRTLAKRSRR